jgi:hypothetical protein
LKIKTRNGLKKSRRESFLIEDEIRIKQGGKDPILDIREENDRCIQIIWIKD